MTPKINQWYASKCDGTWEHDHGVDITTCDNPGWIVKIRLADTEIEPGDRTLFGCGSLNDGKPWCEIKVDGDTLVGACSPERVQRLDALLGTFLGVS